MQQPASDLLHLVSAHAGLLFWSFLRNPNREVPFNRDDPAIYRLSRSPKTSTETRPCVRETLCGVDQKKADRPNCGHAYQHHRQSTESARNVNPLQKHDSGIEEVRQQYGQNEGHDNAGRPIEEGEEYTQRDDALGNSRSRRSDLDVCCRHLLNLRLGGSLENPIARPNVRSSLQYVL